MNDRITVYQGDCLEVMKTLPDDSVDSVVTDPPAGIGFMGKDWDHSRGGREKWSKWLAERLCECLRVAKPGAHALVWALPRTSHWTACAIEDAGWIIEDRVSHIFGTGFPKHKSKLKPAVEDWWLATKSGGEKWLGVDACRVEPTGERLGGGGEKQDLGTTGWDRPWRHDPIAQEAHAARIRENVEKATAMGRWPANLVLSHHPECKPSGTPQVEDYWLATKPGGEKWLGVDACRIEGVVPQVTRGVAKRAEKGDAIFGNGKGMHAKPILSNPNPGGRWPANLVLSHHPECKPNGTKTLKVHWSQPTRGTTKTSNVKTMNSDRLVGAHVGYADADGTETVQAFDCHPECPVRILDEQSGYLSTHCKKGSVCNIKARQSVAWGKVKDYTAVVGVSDAGGASRYFPRFLYCPKAWRTDRGEGNTHPTVKAEPLMRWLCKLVTPIGGTVLDPFAGSGSTGFAAEAEGFHSILIEQSSEYIEIIKNRMTAFQEQTPLFK